ncbi:Tryptophan synthase alpha chain [Rosistilla carotiformis]|uniref:Tryptophan synthase alpha chain n=1 Tax=Rosistilla carotiformis TaxID=2528017 RepID=A0A518JQR8_9BACT|nr:tryptophan synthase subunit alpha [Rosistilla carotiformis]QDV67882.1 Tryptophan synthase alpha chain [Rosistilla carotiformis]
MSLLDETFAKLRSEGRKALLPFITAGDPDLDFTADLLKDFGKAGVAACEVGVPYSDPVADGPVIQASYQRALESGFRLQQLFEMRKRVAAEITIPTLTMASYAIIYRVGLERYIEQSQEAGFCGAIVPDLLVEEAAEFSKLCADRDFNLIQLVTPTTPRQRQVRIAESSSGFLYFVSVTGITGERNELPPQLIDNVGWLREQTDVPVCIGFGISQPEHVAKLGPVADGLIVGSAIVRRIAQANAENRGEVRGEIDRYVREMLAAINAVK